jgi:catechol 2,3-dioxygenase-like lactoylglutathione lyase family enzyme
MEHKAISIRPFVGAKDFEVSRRFYRDLGFGETVLSPNLSVFKVSQLAFYLQDAYVAGWINNTMLFLEVDSVVRYYDALKAMDLSSRYTGVKLSPIRTEDWGMECFLHDPSGILWHIGEFSK